METFKIGKPVISMFADSKCNVEPKGATIAKEHTSKKGNRLLVVEFEDGTTVMVMPENLAYAHTQTPFLGTEEKKGNKKEFVLATDVSEGEFQISPDAKIGVSEGKFYAA